MYRWFEIQIAISAYRIVMFKTRLKTYWIFGLLSTESYSIIYANMSRKKNNPEKMISFNEKNTAFDYHV